MRHTLKLICIIGFLLAAPLAAFATTYNVGAGQTYTTIGAVPWYTLGPGDTVYIYPGTYHEKFQVSTQGTAQNPIRVLGVLDANGNRPIIDGQNATTSTNNHFHWQDATGSSAMQLYGVVFVSINANNVIPAYIQIKNLEIKNGYKTYNFTTENGATTAYDGSAAGVYIRSASHVLIENCVVHDNGEGIYNWTGPDNPPSWYSGLDIDLTLRGNYFYNNGQTSSYTEHQTYTEALGVTIEYNHYGPMRSGSLGSHLKDRSAGTVIRYNYFDSAPSGWVIDLVEPQNSYPTMDNSNTYQQAFVYGNLVINKGNYSPNYFHWNEDHQMGQGRATLTGGKLLFYDNTVLTIANQSDMASFQYFNETWGGYECPSGSLPGIVDVRNNIFAVLPRTAGQPIPAQQFAYCNNQNLNFGVNWVSPGWSSNTSGTVTGTANLYVPAANNPGFVSSSSPYDLHLLSSSDALNKGGASAPEMTSNYLGLNLTPTAQYLDPQSTETRSGLTSLGAFEYGSGSPPPVTHTVTPSAGANGSISPNTAQTVNDGSTTMFTVTPNANYTATVGGTCGGALSGTTYTTNPITADCTVTATFSGTTITHTVTPSAGANGSISPNTAQTVVDGSTTIFTVTPNANYIASMGGSCGGTLSGTTYTTHAIMADCTVTASFTAVPTYTIGGTITNLAGTISLADANAGTASVSSSSFTLPNRLITGTSYNVTVSAQPASRFCTVSNGSGTINGANVTNVSVSCANTYTVGGTLSGFSGNGTVTIQNNGSDTLHLSGNGAFTFTSGLLNGAAYLVTVTGQPSGQTCTVSNGAGNISGASITNITISCANTGSTGKTPSTVGSVQVQ